ncbi:unnamed protein product [Pipistrellus nathusii]|uniref:Uncharacterized protein n=1 Tax=Pipistrellus nathusii TaxID=59473 RepID=A0ABN9ZDB8_PIPNA
MPPVLVPTGDRTRNVGRYLDQESYLSPFGMWNDAPTTEPPGNLNKVVEQLGVSFGKSQYAISSKCAGVHRNSHTHTQARQHRGPARLSSNTPDTQEARRVCGIREWLPFLYTAGQGRLAQKHAHPPIRFIVILV